MYIIYTYYVYVDTPVSRSWRRTWWRPRLPWLEGRPPVGGPRVLGLGFGAQSFGQAGPGTGLQLSVPKRCFQHETTACKTTCTG